MADNLRIKAELLSYGMQITDAALQVFSLPYLGKRRAYSNTDSKDYFHVNIPQEVILLPERIVVGVTINHSSPWVIDHRTGEFCLVNQKTDEIATISFTLHPPFYGLEVEPGILVEHVLTYIFGHSLGIFVNSSCYFATPERHCRYCSIKCNGARPKDNVKVLNAQLIAKAVDLALQHDGGLFDSIFISGGNFNDFDANFARYVDIAKAVMDCVRRSGKQVRVMLSVFPPKDKKLLDLLRDTGIDVLLGTEAFSEKAYATFCPGKSKVLSKARLYDTLAYAVSVLGKGHVYSIVIHGLEDDETVICGVERYAQMGVGTIVNVLHMDPGTEINNMNVSIPSPQSILTVTKAVAKIYAQYGFDTHQAYGGRSSFDAECSTLLKS